MPINFPRDYIASDILFSFFFFTIHQIRCTDQHNSFNFSLSREQLEFTNENTTTLSATINFLPRMKISFCKVQTYIYIDGLIKAIDLDPTKSVRKGFAVGRSSRRSNNSNWKVNGIYPTTESQEQAIRRYSILSLFFFFSFQF